MIKRGPGNVGSNKHIMTSKGTTTAMATRHVEGGDHNKQLNLSTPVAF
jgi:hypothetical protein